MPSWPEDVMPYDVAVYYDESMQEHDPGPLHPERPRRLQAIVDHLHRRRIHGVKWREPTPADESHLALIHDDPYIQRINDTRGQSVHLDPDTATSPASVDAAYLAAGAAVNAVEAVTDGGFKRAFALVRPPGHHAERDVAKGFCLFNNIAIAAAHALKNLNYQRVLLVDFDVHHCNGTQQAFWNRDDVLTFSSHRYPFYPGTGALDEVGSDAGKGLTVNMPLPPGQDDSVHYTLMEGLLWPIAEQFKPDLVLVSAGYDSHREDLLGGMRVTDEGFAAFTSLLCDIATRYAGGKVAMILEGGYDLAALARGVHNRRPCPECREVALVIAIVGRPWVP
jgi:acetoin utilization deacetylase AcuC-like enzyme